MLQLLRIERPPLGAANTPSIRQRGVTAAALSSQPLVGGAEADARMGGQGQEGFAVINVSAQQPFPSQSVQRVSCRGICYRQIACQQPDSEDGSEDLDLC